MSYPNVGKLYQGVIDDVINGVREAFLDEGVDEQVLQELKQLWESKVNHHKAVSDVPQRPPVPTQAQQQPQTMLVMDSGRHDRLHHPVLPQQRATGPQPLPTQLVYSLQPTGPLDLSGAAATATMALPPPLYQLGGFTLQHNPQGHLVAVPTGLPIVQLPGQLPAQLEPQNLSKSKDVPGGMHVVQLDGTADNDIGSDSNDMAGGVSNTIGLAYSKGSAEPSVCCASGCLKSRRQRTGKPVKITIVLQTDGAHSNSSSDDDDDDEDDGHGVDDDNADAGDDDEVDGEAGSNDDKPLNSDDDVDDGASDLFDTENLVVCQFDKINRSKSKWKFHLKDGIMNLKGKDYVFHKATGEAEW